MKDLAERIVADLFTNGAGEKARRLVFELENGRSGGGWSEVGARVQVQQSLAAILNPESEAPREQ